MDLSRYNKNQCKAIEHMDGPCCTIAGAGSGKTSVLTGRVVNLVERGVSPENILAVTFTKKAANEMIERLQPQIGDSALSCLNVGTFHSICYRILREEWYDNDQDSYELAQESWQKRTIRGILEAPSNKNPKGMDWDLDIGVARSFISWQKNNLITPDGKLDFPSGTSSGLEHKYRTMYRSYEKAKEEDGKLDFDDMLLWCYLILKDNPGVLSKYQERYKYILVDEFQDTNKAQYEILKLLAAPENNIFVVGDARQAIYGWRAARVEFILKFQEVWSEAKIVILETNYRSTPDIVRLSNKFIKNGSVSYPGECKAANNKHIAPQYLHSEDEDDEAYSIVQEIQSQVKTENRKYSDIAVLYRCNAQSRALEDALIKAEVPYIILGSQGFYSRKEVKDILAYLRVLVDPDDEESIRRIINIPTRYLGKVFIQCAIEYSHEKDISLLDAISACPESKIRRYRGAKDFIRCFNKLKNVEGTPGDLIYKVRSITGYDKWLAEAEGADEGADNQRIENLNALASAAYKFNNLQDFLFYAEQAAKRTRNDDGKVDRVQLMTLHRSKGLEFPVVFIAGMAQGLLPHHKSCVYINGELVPESIEEERRLCYVGMTRAKEQLYMSTIDFYQYHPMERSIFLDEIHPLEDSDADGSVMSMGA